MTKYREILRLKSLGFSERNIAQSCGVSRNTVAKVLKKAAEINLSWPLDFDMTDSALEELMFPKDKSATNKRMPNFDYIRKELLRNGVNKKLLWVEYCEECRMSSEELDTQIEVGELIDTIEYDYTSFHLSMDCFWCKIVKGNLVLKEHEAAKWLGREELDSVDWLPADITLIKKLRKNM